MGYAEAKWVCEAILDETLHGFPDLIRPLVTRRGQIAGSSRSGYWNTVEHLPFFIKSAQSLRARPDLDGVMQWMPPLKDMNRVLAHALGIPESTSFIPLKDWVRRIRASPLESETENPGARPGIPDWLESNFERMACGGLILDTERAQEHSGTMARDVGPVSAEVVSRFLDYWRKVSFLH
ncbi:uncharacterized protein ATNIH1004_008972 [Aspergillus tanneri]|uniref:Thioester reductase (TE) domain-containing protein n=1 Tax=Aspergillus tanneri TaxID=1220188 RepID=A0A5M9MHG4_9EURO|nr:uncharacterized protein ATNIH1004_008972 [Aspergillus tanneri]KAA8644764.1 hypothetical protein ATNIH1004_008972 [Aspergillus tanneri]